MDYSVWFRIVARVLTYSDDISIILTPPQSMPLMIACSMFWIPWWVMIGFGLFRLANKQSNEGKEA